MDYQYSEIDYAVRLSYEAVDASELSAEDKRRVLFSVYSFGCLFGTKERHKVSRTLVKYGCTFIIPLEKHPKARECAEEFDEARREGKVVPLTGGGVFVKHNAKPYVKFDAGSELFFHFVGAGKIKDGFAAAPEKYSLYETVNIITSLKNATDGLKAAWYLVFPYIVMIGAPIEPHYYDLLTERLVNDTVFESVINLRHSIGCADSVSEMIAYNTPSVVIEWLRPYIEWKNERDEDGFSREVKRFQKWVNDGMFHPVFEGTEKLLDTFPDDENLHLVNLAARISLNTLITKKEYGKLLEETAARIEQLLDTRLERRDLFLYYYGIVLLGQLRLDDAEKAFADCLKINPASKSAKEMREKIELIKSRKG